MTDNDSSLFGNNNELYSSKRQYEEYDPFSQTPPAASEPLFPHAPAPQKPAAQNRGGDAPTETGAFTNEPSGSRVEASGNALYDQQSYDQQIYAQLTYDQLLYDQQTAQGRTTPPTHNEQNSQNVPNDTPYVGVVAAPEPTRYAPSVADGGKTVEPLYGAAAMPPAISAVAQHKAAINDKDAAFNRQFAVLMDLMQHGAWPQVLEKIQAMRVEYPHVQMLEALQDEATMKAELMAQWAHKIKGRRLTVGQEWLIRRSLPFVLLLALFISGTVFYRTFVAPSRQVVAMERANQALVEEATGLLQAGQIDQAIELFDLVLSRNPDNGAAQQGLLDANRLSGLAATYDVAIRVANHGNLKRALAMLQSVKAKSPAFRDIDARIARVQGLLEAEAAYQLAEKAFVQRRWVDAIRYYEQTQLLDSDYQSVRVGLQMSVAYFMAAQKLTTQWPTAEFGTEQIRDFLRKAQSVNGENETIRTFLVQLDDFIQGERALRNNNLDHAVKLWRDLYDVQPAFLGGYLAEELYRAHLAYAAEVRESDPDLARELYTFAAGMPVHDSGEARNQLQNLGAAAPAAQPTPTPQPTLAFFAPVAVAAAAPAPVETPTPAPTPTPANNYAGWIAFRSTRDGSEQIYVMRGDGSEQQLAPEEIRSRFDGLYQEERRAPDGRVAYVQSATGRSDANLYIASSDGVNVTTLTDGNTDEYDPVWSRVGDRIAYVSNNTGNDEIWTIRADGSEARQLTYNNWEWDKHPTWSPDGNQIAFFSNRSGQRQIWAMNADGSGQRNVSNNAYDDWDPVWIK